YGLKRDDIEYKDLDDAKLVSPIIMSMRMLDQSEDLERMLQLIYDLYVEHGMEYLPPSEPDSPPAKD
ncbi:LysR family transcriptional regulator, partial [Burkholderia sp. TJI49]